MYDYENEGPVVTEIAETVRVSKTERECVWCHIAIHPGQRYRRHVNKIDDEMTVAIGCLNSPNCAYYGRD